MYAMESCKMKTKMHYWMQKLRSYGELFFVMFAAIVRLNTSLKMKTDSPIRKSLSMILMRSFGCCLSLYLWMRSWRRRSKYSGVYSSWL